MSERTQLEQTIMAIEAQRAILGDAAVDTDRLLPRPLVADD